MNLLPLIIIGGVTIFITALPTMEERKKALQRQIEERTKEIELLKQEQEVSKLDYQIKRGKYWWWYALADNLRAMMSNTWQLVVKMANKPKAAQQTPLNTKPQPFLDQRMVTALQAPLTKVLDVPTPSPDPVIKPVAKPQSSSQFVDIKELNKIFGGGFGE